MKLESVFASLLIAASVAFAHCGHCEKMADGPACSKHKMERMVKSDTINSSDSITCPKFVDGAKCDTANCPKHQRMEKCKGKKDGTCPKCKK